MYFPEDEKIAKNLQRNLNGEACNTVEKENISVTDRRLEYHDPTPSIHDLFVSFDKRFFWGKLGMVEVKWSQKMTTCAGLCSYQGKRGLCSIRLSGPLLILRPRKDLVETLLHEMIHAYLFVTQNFKDREDHGPEFHRHMHRINKEAGTNISVYHNFHYEVAFYQTHIWRCTGTCRNSLPFFGFVKRAVNRPPGPYDNWWHSHVTNCGGTFVKISEPDKQSKKKKNANEKDKSRKNIIGMNDIRNFFKTDGAKASTSSSNKNYKGNHSNASNTTIVKDFNNGECSKSNKKSMTNVGDSKETCVMEIIAGTIPSDNKNYGNVTNQQERIIETVREAWTKKYPSPNEMGKKRNNSDLTSPNDLTIEAKKKQVSCPVCNNPFSETVINAHIDECLEEQNSVEILSDTTSSTEDTDESDKDFIQCPVCSESLQQTELNEHLEICFTFTFENEDTTGDDKPDNDKVPCPCCLKWVKEKTINEHIDECLTLISLKKSAGLT